MLDKLRAGDGLDQPRGQVRPRGQVYYLKAMLEELETRGINTENIMQLYTKDEAFRN